MFSRPKVKMKGKYYVFSGYKQRNKEINKFFVYLKCESVGYWYIVVICQNQLTIFIQARSTTIADYPGVNYLLQTLVCLAKIGIISIISGSQNSKLNIF